MHGKLACLNGSALSSCVLLTLGAALLQQKQYLCVADKATGFKFDGVLSRWTSANFRADAKYLVAPSKLAGYAWQVTRMGEQTATALCKEDFNEYGYLNCEGGGGTFRFNRKNGRFLKAYSVGYVNVLPGVNDITDAGSDTPNLEIGTCSPF